MIYATVIYHGKKILGEIDPNGDSLSFTTISKTGKSLTDRCVFFNFIEPKTVRGVFGDFHGFALTKEYVETLEYHSGNLEDYEIFIKQFLHGRFTTELWLS